MFQKFRNGLRAHVKEPLGEFSPLKKTVKWTEFCKAFHMICMIRLHLAEDMSLSCEGIMYIYTGYYCTTIEAKTLNDLIKQRWDVWGHFLVITTFRHLCFSQWSQRTVTSIVYKYVIKDPQFTNSSTWLILTSYREICTVFPKWLNRHDKLKQIIVLKRDSICQRERHRGIQMYTTIFQYLKSTHWWHIWIQESLIEKCFEWRHNATPQW